MARLVLFPWYNPPMDKQYLHTQHEAKMYQLWQDHGAFNPDTVTVSSVTPKTAKARKSFCIIMPPPNANDPLHIGHAMFVSLEDALVRYHRMLGDDTLWVPGTDHAGIETQYVFEKKLKKNGQSRFQYDRETLFKMIWDYVQENSGIAVDQIKQLGASADWSRFKFTLDKDIVKTALETFYKLSKEKLLYRDNKLINYCTKCGTAFSNLEVVHTEKTSPLYYLKYGPFTLATTRPETKFGDTAVAVHPNDKRYTEYVGKEIEVEGLTGPFKLKVIADTYVDPEFGTGVVKITPYHDFNDFLVWQRHKNELPAPQQVIDFNGKLTATAGKYAGLKVTIAREQIVADLEAKGLLVKTNTEYVNSVGTCYRCGTTIEPLPLPQFYIKVKSLTERALKKLDAGEITVTGAGHDKILRHWLTKLEDWNISRQIVWGIRIPVWYDTTKNPDISVVFIDKSSQKQSGSIGELLKTYSLAEITAGLQTINTPITAEYVLAETAPGPSYIQETDTFDTWFSSGQWPFATLKNTKPGDFERFYPTSVMETGYDILPIWVLRMILMGLFATDTLPFTQVYLHGLVRDSKGLKMSKSKGNVVNPLEITQKYGADALRMALVIRSSPGLDKSVGEADFKAMRNLTNKLWNAARFVLTRQETPVETLAKDTTAADKAFAEKLANLQAQLTKNFEKLQLGLAAETSYNEFWHWYCDQAIEQTKQGELSDLSLLKGLITFLKLLHPFMPFVTEAVWQQLFERNLVTEPLLITSPWNSVQ